jgi:hypothetical protein
MTDAVVQIDLTKYYRPQKVHYFFRPFEILEQDSTLTVLAADAGRFRSDGNPQGSGYLVTITEEQNEKLLNFLKAGVFRCSDFKKSETPNYVLAPAFGDGVSANMQLADRVQVWAKKPGVIASFTQSNIADILYERDNTLRKMVQRIDFELGQDYVTTGSVIRQAAALMTGEPRRVVLIAQAWHAPRALRLCSEAGLEVTAGSFVDEFSPSDPQPWVRNWLVWLFKESTNR